MEGGGCGPIDAPDPSIKPQTLSSELDIELKLNYDRQSIGQSVLVSGAHLGPAIDFPFCLKFSLYSCGFVIL
jgi:hypothetical protein